MSFDAYLNAMKDFMPVITGWKDELRQLSEATRTKPEMGSGDAIASLARRGRSIAGDLAGTAGQAPAAMRPAHDKLVAAVEGASAAAEAGGPGLADAVEEHLGSAGSALMALRSVLDRGPIVPNMPAPGPGGVSDH